MEPLAVSLEEAAKLLGLSKFTIRRYVSRGLLKATRCGRRIIIPIAELKRLALEGVSDKAHAHPRT
jgi:excisionase family DNA binding protein